MPTGNWGASTASPSAPGPWCAPATGSTLPTAPGAGEPASPAPAPAPASEPAVDAPFSTLPDESAHPGLVKVFFDAQHDYLRDGVYLLAALVVGPEGERVILEHTTAPVDPAAEGDLLERWVPRVYGAVVAMARTPEAFVHLYAYSRQDQSILLAALRRHVGRLPAIGALFDLLTDDGALARVSPLAQPMISFLAEEVRDRRTLDVTCTSLHAVATRMGFRWQGTTPSGRPADFQRRFRARVFDGRRLVDLPPRPSAAPNGRQAPGGPGQRAWIESAARFRSQIPLEYAYGAWGALPAPTGDLQARLLQPYTGTTWDELAGFAVHRLRALLHMEQRLGPKSRFAGKRRLPLLDLTERQPRPAGAPPRPAGLPPDRAPRPPAGAAPGLRPAGGAPGADGAGDAPGVPGVREPPGGPGPRQRAPPLRAPRPRPPPRGASPALRGGRLGGGQPPPRQPANRRAGLRPGRFPQTLPRPARAPGHGGVHHPRGPGGPARPRWPRRGTARRPGHCASPWPSSPSPSATASSPSPTAPGTPCTPGARYVVDEMADDLNGDKLLAACRAAANPDLLPNPLLRWITRAEQEAQPEQAQEQEQGPAVAVAGSAPAPASVMESLLQTIDAVERAAGAPGPTPRQREAIAGGPVQAGWPVLLIQGPPGSGKSHTLGWTVLAHLAAAHLSGASGCRVAVSSKTHNAIRIVLASVAQKLARLRRHAPHSPFAQALTRLRVVKAGGPGGEEAPEQAPSATPEGVPEKTPEETPEETPAIEPFDPYARREEIEALLATPWLVLGATPGGLYSLQKYRPEGGRDVPWDERPFHLVVLDEASQVNVPEALLACAFVRPDGRAIVVGDHRQMPPIVAVSWNEEARRTVVDSEVYRSVFDFLRARPFPRVGLDQSFRLPSRLAAFLEELVYRQDGIPFYSRRQERLPPCPTGDPYVDAVLHPAHPVVVVEHEESASHQVSPVELELLTPILHTCTEGLGLDGATGIGVVVPHRAQRALLRARFPALAAGNAIDTVERFQGGEREVIVVSATASDPDYILSEADFLLNPNRLNVALSRPRRKLIVIASGTLLRLLTSDPDLFEQATLWKRLRYAFASAPLWAGARAGTAVRVFGAPAGTWNGKGSVFGDQPGRLRGRAMRRTLVRGYRLGRLTGRTLRMTLVRGYGPLGAAARGPQGPALDGCAGPPGAARTASPDETCSLMRGDPPLRAQAPRPLGSQGALPARGPRRCARPASPRAEPLWRGGSRLAAPGGGPQRVVPAHKRAPRAAAILRAALAQKLFPRFPWAARLLRCSCSWVLVLAIRRGRGGASPGSAAAPARCPGAGSAPARGGRPGLRGPGPGRRSAPPPAWRGPPP